MVQFRTDAFSVAMILGGAALAGGATILLASTGPESAESVECSHLVSHAQVARHLVVAAGAAESSVVISPRVTRDAGDCSSVVHLTDARAEQVKVQVREALERAQEARQRAPENPVRAQERVQRAVERAKRRAEEMRAHELQEAMTLAESRASEGAQVRVHGLDGFDFDFDQMQFDIEFDGETLVVDVEGMEDFVIDMREFEAEMEELGRELELEIEELGQELELEMDDLARELEAELGDLERDFEGADWDELSSEEREEIERRVEDAMRRLEERLSRIGTRRSGGRF